LRIVFVIPHADLSGGVRTVAIYARLLSARGHKVTVVSTPRPGPSLRTRVKSLVRGRGWPGDPIQGASHLDHLSVEHHRLDRFRPVTDRDVPDADVVVATWWLTAEWVASLAPCKGAKVHFVQGNDSDLPGQPQARVAATWRLPFHRIVCSRWLLDLARNRYGDATAACVPNGVDLEQFTTRPRERQSRPTVGLVYSDTWIKGCDVAVAAIRMAMRRIPSLRLVAFGSAPVSAMVPLPPNAEFTLLPPQGEIARLYASCDVWLWPSRQEGFGLPILEAMACRTPVIAAMAGAAPELLGQGGGWLVPVADASAMALAIERANALSRGEWQEISQEARTVAARHRWEASAVAFEAEIEAARLGRFRTTGQGA
jgi:glycosyltransferase involved in cell wall biosynthesis